MPGINPRFRRLSQSQGQVAHVLLTRSPLGARRHLVRLACVKHAASVRPEPGSNSPLNDCRQDPPQETPETRNPTMSHIMAKTAGQGPKTRPDGGLYIYHALAFSTLLSSQETDAHRRRNYHSPPGQPLNLTLESLSCQLRFRKPSGRRSGAAISPDTKGHPPSAWWPLGHTQNLRKLAPRWLPGSRAAFRRSVPSGHEELYDWREAPSNRALYSPGHLR